MRPSFHDDNGLARCGSELRNGGEKAYEELPWFGLSASDSLPAGRGAGKGADLVPASIASRGLYRARSRGCS